MPSGNKSGGSPSSANPQPKPPARGVHFADTHVTAMSQQPSQTPSSPFSDHATLTFGELHARLHELIPNIDVQLGQMTMPIATLTAADDSSEVSAQSADDHFDGLYYSL